MTKLEEIRTNYLKDADQIGSKSRFGFFSIPPNTTAGINLYPQKKALKDESGKVKTEQRNIYSGPGSNGTLKKSYFQYQSSVFVGDPYNSASKLQSLSQLQKSNKLQGKDIYKIPSLAKTPVPKSSYEHIAQQPIQKQVKDYVDENGKVQTQQRNMSVNLSSTIKRQREKQYKYMHDPYENHKRVQSQQLKQSLKLRGEQAFKSSSPGKQCFSTSRQLYGIQGCSFKEKIGKKMEKNKGLDDTCFRPSCSQKYDIFSYPEYIPCSQRQKDDLKRKSSIERAETFRLVKQPNYYKPSPSISTMKSNILRKLR